MVKFGFKHQKLTKIALTSYFKETKSATKHFSIFFYFLFKSFVKVELSYVFTINLFTIAVYLFTIAENCTEK